MGRVSKLTGFPCLLWQSAPGVRGGKDASSEIQRSGELHPGDMSELSRARVGRIHELEAEGSHLRLQEPKARTGI